MFKRFLRCCFGVVLLMAAQPAGIAHVREAADADSSIVESRTYRGEPSRSGFVSSPGFSVPLEKVWERVHGASFTYAVGGGGRIFITTGNPGWSGAQLWALDASTGKHLWGPLDLGSAVGPSNDDFSWPAKTLAYANGKVFVSERNETVSAFDAVTGTVAWNVPLEAPGLITPAAEVLYVQSENVLHVLDQNDGSLQWSKSISGSAAAVSPTSIFISAGCNYTIAMDRLSGEELWRYSEGCSGGGGLPAVFHEDRVYVRSTGRDGVVLDARSGAKVAELSSETAPALGASTAIYTRDATVEARDINTGAQLWRFVAPGDVVNDPLIIDQLVMVTTQDARFYALSLDTGAVAWAGAVGAAMVSHPYAGMSLIGQTLIVPAQDRVVAFRPADAVAPPALEPLSPPVFDISAPTSRPKNVVSQQIDPRHSGLQRHRRPPPPLKVAWRKWFRGEEVSYPLVANGRVFVTVGRNAVQKRGRLFAFDLRTGKRLWSRSVQRRDSIARFVNAAYYRRRIYTLAADGVLRALRPRDGRLLWRTKLPDRLGLLSAAFYEGAPVVRRGRIVTIGAGRGRIVAANSWKDGRLLWAQGLSSGGQNTFAAGARHLYTAYACHAVSLNVFSGARDWTFDQGCDGGRGETPSLYRNTLYARGLLFGNVTLDAASGAPEATFSAGPPPAFSGDIGLFAVGDVVQAVHLRTRTIVWTSDGQPDLLTAPVVGGRHVFVATAAGRVIALSLRTGRTVWQIETHRDIKVPPTDEWQVHTGLGIGGRRLLVPGRRTLTAFKGA